MSAPACRTRIARLFAAGSVAAVRRQSCWWARGYHRQVSVADERYPDLHRLIERLEPDQAAQVREQILRLVTPPQGLRVLGVFDGPAEDLGARSEEIIRNEAGQ